ncbi:hypothetical protein [Methylopila sp. M107]|uniref:hypothetical protein n=1 Tax=Methylopila sp. M107 TaxID=1101190 RepID=UPI0012DF5438|nr:hypothetical protein [Methylopila sp. M107]
MKLVLLSAGALVIATSGAFADPITRYTITGRSAAAASAQGVPLDQTPKPPAPETQATAEGGAAPAAGTPGAEAGSAPAKPKVVRYGLLGLSWRSE